MLANCMLSFMGTHTPSLSLLIVCIQAAIVTGSLSHIAWQAMSLQPHLLAVRLLTPSAPASTLHWPVPDRFKLLLAEDYNDTTGVLALPAGLSPLRVISDYLRYPKDFTLAKLNVQWGSETVSAQDVMWTMTIPAAWSETAKQTMRRAAVMAGLVSHPGSRYIHVSVCYTFCLLRDNSLAGTQ